MIRFLLFLNIFCIGHSVLVAKIPFLNQNPLVVSLGGDCQVALNLRTNGVRGLAYPFDWINSPEFESIIAIIEDDFKYWLEPSFLEHSGNKILNRYYNIKFAHDFPTSADLSNLSAEGFEGVCRIVDDFYNYLPLAEEKYNRRIKRFRELLESSSPIIFIRAYATPNSASQFVDLIKSKYPNLKFLLVILNDSDEYNFDWKIENVKFIYCKKDRHSSKKWWDEKVWKKVLLKLGLLN